MEVEAAPKKETPKFFGRRKTLIMAGAMLLVLIIGGVAAWKVFERQRGYSPAHLVTGVSKSDKDVEVGKQLSGGKCSGTGSETLTNSAINPSDFVFMIPYGLMVGGHVTPIDHQYYQINPGSARDAYPVYAMGDATIVSIEHRTNSPGDNQHVQQNKTDEYRIIFSHSCTFFYYYDLLTSLSGEVKAKFEAAGGGNYAGVDIPVKAGQEIGRIGGQTLDYAVWDTTKKLKSFVVSDRYQDELWKIYVADPLNYYSSDLKTFMLSRYPRTEEPLSGKMDWDIDGKLRGNWFVKGTTGYTDKNNQQAPWSIQLSFAGDLYDPGKLILSMGDYGPGPQPGVNAQQFYVKGDSPDFAQVSQSSGLVKYELVSGSYTDANGLEWRGERFVKGPKVVEGTQVMGVALVQMIDGRTLKFESFPNKTAAQVSGFDDKAKLYTR